MQTEEPVSTREYTEIMVIHLDSTYVEADLEQVAANAFYLNADEIIKLLSILNEFEWFFDSTLVEWGKDQDAKLVNIKY